MGLFFGEIAMAKQYALYRGDTFMEIGTRTQLAELLNVDAKTITFYASPAYRKRFEKSPGNMLLVIRIEDDEG